jgi:hypothetical protein
VLVLIALIAAGLIAFIFYRMETWPARAARQVREAFGEVAQLQPKITVKERVFFEQTASVLELTVASRVTQVEREFDHSWLGSTKRLRLSGTYDVRAGFDLTKPFNVTVVDSKVTVEVPPPRILSVDQKDIEVLAFENGLWNRVQPQELEAELRTLPLHARARATEAGLQKEALELFTKRLKERLAPKYEVEVIVASPKRGIGDPKD